MKKLYTLILKNEQGEVYVMKVAATTLTHALERAERFGMEKTDKLQDFTCAIN